MPFNLARQKEPARQHDLKHVHFVLACFEHDLKAKQTSRDALGFLHPASLKKVAMHVTCSPMQCSLTAAQIIAGLTPGQGFNLFFWGMLGWIGTDLEKVDQQWLWMIHEPRPHMWGDNACGHDPCKPHVHISTDHGKYSSCVVCK